MICTYQFYNERIIEGDNLDALLGVAQDFEQFARSQGLPDTVPPFRYSTDEGSLVYIDLHATHPAWALVAFDPHAFKAWAEKNGVDLID